MLRSLAGGALFGETWGDALDDPDGPAGPGEQPLVLALHGWRRTHADFAPSLGPGAPGAPGPPGVALPTVAPDLPGFGATPPPPLAWGSEEYADAVVPLLDTAGDGGATAPDAPPPRRAVVVGHSLGGRVAVRLASRRPDLVGALVLTGAPLVARLGPRPAPFAFRMARRLHRAGVVGEARMERARRRYGSADYRAATGVMRDVLVRMVNERYEDAVAALRCPVELVWGDDDAEAPLETAQALAAAIPGANLEICPGAGHLLPLTAPLALRAAVERAADAGGGDAVMLGAVTLGHGGRGAVIAVAAVAIALSGLRWLRVAQREHYAPEAASRFALRWWTATPVNALALVAALAGLVAGDRWALGPWSRRWWWPWGRPASGSRGAAPRCGGRAGCAHWPWCGASSRPPPSRPAPGGGRDLWPRRRPRWWRRPWSTWRACSRRPSSADWARCTWPAAARLAAGAPDRRRHHRLLRQDHDQGLRGPPGGRPSHGDGHARPASTTAPGWPAP